MTDVRAFRALRYDPARVDLSRVIAPPYDVISPEGRALYHDRDPHNAVHLDLTRDPAEEATTDYSHVRRALSTWRREGVLRLDPVPALYVLRQRFRAPDGRDLERRGFFAEVRIEGYERGIVRPHERTLSGPKADRLKQLRATRANLSSVFLLYEDPDGEIEPLLAPERDVGPADRATGDDGVENALCRIDKPDAIEAVRAFLAERPVVIADGHHRYESALAYLDECREERAQAGVPEPADPPEGRLLAYLANAHAPGSLLLPIHRVIRRGPMPPEARWRQRLRDWEERAVHVPDPNAIPSVLAEQLAVPADRHAFAVDDGSGTLRIFSRTRTGAGDLTIQRLHDEVVQGIFGLDDEAVRQGAMAYAKDSARAARQVRSGAGAAALYLNALRPSEVFDVTAAGALLPQKSTYFAPKVPSGLVFRLLDGEPPEPA